MAHITRFGAFAGVIAAASMTVAPAQAAPQIAPTGISSYATGVHADFAQGGFGSTTYEEQAETAEYRGRRYRGRRGYRRGHRRGSGILTGILVLGGIAAIASAANSNNRRRDREVVVVERDRDNRRYDDRRSNPRSSNGSGIDNAVSQCLTEIERDVRVEGVDGASRLAQGWVVSGTLFNGTGFTCQIDNSGRISNIDYGSFSGGSYDGGVDRSATGQLSATSYADARAAVNGQNFVQSAPSDQGQPAYPGGPLPGETFSE